MPIGGWLMTASVVIAYAGRSYYRWKSLAHLSEGGKQRYPGASVPGMWRAAREDYTELGWKYRRRSKRILALPLIVFVLVALFQNWLLRS